MPIFQTPQNKETPVNVIDAQREAYIQLQDAASEMSKAAKRLRDVDPEDPAGIAIAQVCSGITGILLHPASWHLLEPIRSKVVEQSQSFLDEFGGMPN